MDSPHSQTRGFDFLLSRQGIILFFVLRTPTQGLTDYSLGRSRLTFSFYPDLELVEPISLIDCPAFGEMRTQEG